MRKAGADESRRRSGRRRLRHCVLCLAGVGAVALSSCATGGDRESEDPPRASAAAAPSSSGTAAAGPIGTGGTDQDADLPAPQAYPTWDQPARRDAVDRARAALALYARHDLTPRRWWARLAPRLSPAAATAYVGTDPANIPVRSVRGRGHIVATPSTYLALVQIATDVGPYRVLVSREGQGSRWMVERITPPPGARS